jgi:SAM-dependent methyltransferase
LSLIPGRRFFSALFFEDTVMKPIHRTQQAANDIWERFAEADPYTYILTDLKDPDPKKFWESGERTVKEELLPLIQKHGIRRQIGLELGCGVGRLLFPMAREFEEMVGVDIAEGMVRRAISYAGDSGIRNVALAAISGPEDLLRKAGEFAGKVDFLYSLLVFQHIADFAAIEGYLHAVSELLEENGIAYLQFDTREQTLVYQCKTGLPDFVLPRFWRRGIRRIRRSSAELEVCFRRAGLEIVGELNSHSAYHRYVLRTARVKSATP